MKICARLTALALLTGAMLLPSATTHAQSSHPDIDKSISDNVGDPAKFQAFLADLKQAVQKHDADAVAVFVSYPITVNPRTKMARRVRTSKAFVASYDKIITQHIANVIKNQRYEDLFVNYQGAMFGSGEIWVAGICKDKECKQSDIKIRTIQNTNNATSILSK
jgi:hypothetical protein